jgi:hypothetical protein
MAVRVNFGQMFFAKRVDQSEHDVEASVLPPDGGVGSSLGWRFRGAKDVFDIGNDIPCRSLAVLKSWFKFRRMPGPNEML